jgi:hypothetical protein
MCVLNVVQSPLSAPDGELEVPATAYIVAHAGTGFVDLAGNKSDEEVNSTPLHPRLISRGKSTSLEDT